MGSRTPDAPGPTPGPTAGGTDLSTSRLLAFSKRLIPATTFSELLEVARQEVLATVGYRHAWFMVKEREDVDELRLIDYSGDRHEVIWDVAPVLKIEGDAFLEELLGSDHPIVIAEARVDPRTNKELVAQLGNRTLVNIPLRLLDKPFGVFGMGTFGDEGCLVPTPAQLDYLVGMAGQVAVAAARMRYLDEMARGERNRLEMERKLLQSQKLESLGLLAGGIAHDFNNLLTVILSGASLIEKAARDPMMLEDVRAVIEAAIRGRDLTHKLLAMSRQQDLDMKAVDLNSRLAELLALVRRILPESIEVELIRGVHLSLIEGDTSQIDQVFMNLCINARDAMPRGGRLTLETEQVLINANFVESHPWAKPGRYVLVTVTDTGVGMTREVLDRIFDPFFTTKSLTSGTGLGLSMSYGIVRQHGGMLNCYSEPGVGTSFKVYFPAMERLAVTVGTKLKGAVPRAAQGEKILIAEDDPSVRAVAIRILESGGYKVTAVAHGAAAVEAAGRESFDLVILDVVMPGLSCREVVEQIRAVRPRMRILLASGYTAGNVIELLRETGLDLLRKPYDPDRLLFGVRGVLDDDGSGTSI